MTPDEAYDELRPLLEHVGAMIATVPLSAADRYALSLRVVGYFFGFGMRMAGEVDPELKNCPSSHLVDFLAKQIRSSIEREGAPLSS